MAVYAVPIQPIRVREPNYSFKELGDAFDTVRGWRTGRAVGEKLTGNDLRGASVAAFSGGDMRTGLQLRELEAQEAQRAAANARADAAAAEARHARDREEQQRQITILGNLAETVRGIQEPEHRRAAWDRLVAGTPLLRETLQRYGQDPADHVNGPDFIIAQTRDPLARRQVEANIEATQQRGRAREMDAETRRLRTLYDQFQERVGDNPTEEVWNRENQPGGIVHSVFGGPRPFSDAPRLVQQVQERRNQLRIPGEEELGELGLNQSQISAARRQAALRRLYGSAGPGYYWDIDETGRVRRVREGGEDSRNPITTEQIEFNIEQLKDAFTLLAGTTNAEGRLNTRGTSGPVTRGISQIPIVGGYAAPATAEAFRGAEHAALNLSYALSGRQIGQQEQGRIVEMFVPRAGDSNEISAFKLNAAISLFNRLLAARGRPAAERTQIFDSELVRQARNLRRARQLEEARRSGGPPPATPSAPQNPAAQMSDDDLLKALGVK